jgi:hypothetical protein
VGAVRAIAFHGKAEEYRLEDFKKRVHRRVTKSWDYIQVYAGNSWMRPHDEWVMVKWIAPASKQLVTSGVFTAGPYNNGFEKRFTVSAAQTLWKLPLGNVIMHHPKSQKSSALSRS